MDVVSWVSAGVALAGAFATAILGYWQQQRLRTMEQRSLMDSYGASLAWAVYDFQARLFNILHGHAVDREPGEHVGYLTSFLVRGTGRRPNTRAAARCSCWPNTWAGWRYSGATSSSSTSAAPRRTAV